MSPRGTHAEETRGVSATPEAAPLRSWLFVPGDSERKQVKALGSGADVLILDLEDSVALAQRPAARTQVARLRAAGSALAGPQLWVRSSAPEGPELALDLEAVCAGPLPAGLVLPKVSAAGQIIALAERLAALERRRPAGTRPVRLLPLVTETAAGLLALPQYPRLLAGSRRDARERLQGLTWGAEDLSAELGARTRGAMAAGAYTFTFELARTTCLLAASAALGVQAVDTVHTEFKRRRGARTRSRRSPPRWLQRQARHPPRPDRSRERRLLCECCRGRARAARAGRLRRRRQRGRRQSGGSDDRPTPPGAGRAGAGGRQGPRTEVLKPRVYLGASTASRSSGVSMSSAAPGIGTRTRRSRLRRNRGRAP